jgi:hypothetical protein
MGAFINPLKFNGLISSRTNGPTDHRLRTTAVVLSNNNFCHANTTIRSSCIVVNLHAVLNNAKVLIFLCTGVQLHNISYCSQQYKRT